MQEFAMPNWTEPGWIHAPGGAVVITAVQHRKATAIWVSSHWRQKLLGMEHLPDGSTLLALRWGGKRLHVIAAHLPTTDVGQYCGSVEQLLARLRHLSHWVLAVDATADVRYTSLHDLDPSEFPGPCTLPLA